MCMICVEWQKQKMTAEEAFRAIGEIMNTTKDPKKINHLIKLSDTILNKEVPLSETDKELEKAWTKENYEE